MTTLADVAQRAGVSVATVSLVLSGKAQGRVSPATVAKVQEASDSLGYVRNTFAAGMRNQRTRTIGFISEQVLSTPYAVAMVRAVLDVARQHDWSVLMNDAGSAPRQARRAIREMRSRRVDAIIHAAMYHQEIEVDSGVRNVVVLNGYADRDGVLAVVPDEEGAAYEATAHLLALGHRRIAHLSVDTDAVAVGLRIEGYRRALREYGLGEEDEVILYCADNDPSGVDAGAEELLARKDLPTGVFCYNDAVAAGIYRRARHHGLEIPRDLSVIGFDDLRLISTNLDPQLTTMKLPHDEMARWITEQVIAAHGAPIVGRTHKATCQLIQRHSTAPPPH